MKRLFLLCLLVGTLAGTAPAIAQNTTTVDDPRHALGLDTLKQIRPIDLREPNDKAPGTLYTYKGAFYVAPNSATLRAKKLIPEDFKAVYEIYVLYKSAIAEYQSKLPAKHRTIQNIVIIEDRK